MGKLTMHPSDGVYASVERIAEPFPTCVTESGNEATAGGSTASRDSATKRITIRNCAELAARCGANPIDHDGWPVPPRDARRAQCRASAQHP